MPPENLRRISLQVSLRFATGADLIFGSILALHLLLFVARLALGERRRALALTSNGLAKNVYSNWMDHIRP